ncbi:MAG: sodium:solute symporter family transporter, partial [Sphingobacterium sp.]
MIYEISYTALVFFFVFVGLVLGVSFYFGRKKSSSSSYYAAGGQIPWAVNGIAFAGDYLSAASFLGICGMIAVSGFDGFLYAIGFLAGWIVALFLIAEPFKRLGKFTFTDALNAKFNSRAITLTASIGTLIISIFYLIPQMVGAGDLVMPLLGLPHWAGVLLVGAIVIVIVASAGMASTTYVQFLKGGLLIILSVILTFFILKNGLTLNPDFKGSSTQPLLELPATDENGTVVRVPDWEIVTQKQVGPKTFVKLAQNGVERWFDKRVDQQGVILVEALSVTDPVDGELLYNGKPREDRNFYQVGSMSKIIVNGEQVSQTGPLGP